MSYISNQRFWGSFRGRGAIALLSQLVEREPVPMTTRSDADELRRLRTENLSLKRENAGLRSELQSALEKANLIQTPRTPRSCPSQVTSPAPPEKMKRVLHHESASTEEFIGFSKFEEAAAATSGGEAGVSRVDRKITDNKKRKADARDQDNDTSATFDDNDKTVSDLLVADAEDHSSSNLDSPKGESKAPHALEGGLNSYELLREQNMARNAAKIMELGLGSTFMKEAPKQKRPKTLAHRSQASAEAAPLRTSQRKKSAPKTYSERDSDYAERYALLPDRPRDGFGGGPEDILTDIFPAAICRKMASQIPEVAQSTLEKQRFGRPQGGESSTSELSSTDTLSYTAVYRALDQVFIPENEGRVNVRHHVDGEEVRSMTTGVVGSRSTGGVQLAGPSKRRPNLTRLLVAFGRAHIPEKNFSFNAITINKDLETAMHVDKANMGPSYIVALGNYSEGGEIWTLVNGSVDIKHSFLSFDGNLPHCTLPWAKGRRYSLVFYTNRFNSNVTEFDRKYLVEELGFPLPLPTFTGPRYREGFHINTEERLEAAREAFTTFEVGVTRFSTLGTVINGIEIGRAKLIKSFDTERLDGQSWAGAFVGTIVNFEAGYFGVLYDDGDYETMDLDEIATCGCRFPDAVAPQAARDEIARGNRAGDPTDEDSSPPVGFTLAPVTLADDQLASIHSTAKTHRRSVASGVAKALADETSRRRELLKNAMIEAKSIGNTAIQDLCTRTDLHVFPVEATLGSRVLGDRAEVLVKWKIKAQEDTWEFADDLILFADLPKALSGSLSEAESVTSAKIHVDTREHSQGSITTVPIGSMESSTNAPLAAAALPESQLGTAQPGSGKLFKLDVYRTEQNSSLGVQLVPSLVSGRGDDLPADVEGAPLPDSGWSQAVVNIMKPDSPFLAAGCKQGDVLIVLGEHNVRFVRNLDQVAAITRTLPLNFSLIVQRRETSNFPVETGGGCTDVRQSEQKEQEEFDEDEPLPEIFESAMPYDKSGPPGSFEEDMGQTTKVSGTCGMEDGPRYAPAVPEEQHDLLPTAPQMQLPEMLEAGSVVGAERSTDDAPSSSEEGQEGELVG